MKPLRIRNPDEQTRRFYRGYDPFFLRQKAWALVVATEHWEAFSALSPPQDPLPAASASRTRTALRAHIRFAEFQQFEACFALMLAQLQQLPPWAFLSTYATAELRELAVGFADDKIVTSGTALDAASFVVATVYGGERPDALASVWQTNISNIVWVLQRVARRYEQASSFGGEYNAYKHGARVLLGPSSVFVSETPDTLGQPLAHSQDSVTTLELEKTPELIDVYQTVTHFNPAASYFHIDFMSRLCATIQSIQLMRLGEQNAAALHAFSKLDRERVRELERNFKFRMSS